MSNKILLSVLFFIISTQSKYIKDDNCRISIEYKTGDIKEPQPLILTKIKNNTSFLYPNDKEGYINIRQNSIIKLACIGKNNYLQGINKLIKNTREIQIKCVRKKTFKVDGNDNENSIEFNITNVTCKYLSENEARSTKNKCYNDITYTEIGFSLQNEFFPTLEVCHDNISHSTYYTKYKLTKTIGHRQSSFPRPRKWTTGQFFTDYNMEDLYKMKTQFNTVMDTVGSEELAKKYIGEGTIRYMSRGHMVAKADLLYGNAQRTTFWYINTAPQWQSFNGGNWNALEDNIRSYAAKNLLNLEIYTGVYGQMNLIDINNNPVPLYFFVNGTSKSLPIPQYYWKIIYDPVRKLGTAFVGSNDPYALEISEEIYLCEDIANKIKWLTWKPNIISNGISYACAIDDISEVIPSLPKLEVYGILL